MKILNALPYLSEPVITGNTPVTKRHACTPFSGIWLSFAHLISACYDNAECAMPAWLSGAWILITGYCTAQQNDGMVLLRLFVAVRVNVCHKPAPAAASPWLADHFASSERWNMQIYRHALLLVQNETDGLLLLQHAERLAKDMGTLITVGHISDDYREMDYISDSLTKDRQSEEIIAAKAMLSRLVEASSIDIQVKSIVSIHRFDDIKKLVQNNAVDLVMLGHKNRLFGVFSSFSFEFINHLSIDVLIKHISAS